jgi:hypothetical protein
LKERAVTDYPDSLVDAMVALVQNPQLVTVFMTIIFLKTNAYDSSTLCTTMTLIQRMLNSIEKLGHAFPSNFDFNFFLKGINISLEVEHSLSTPRTLYLLYRCLHYFPIDQRGIII